MKNKNTYSENKLFKIPIWRQHNPKSISYKILNSFINICCKYLPIPVRKHIFSYINVITPISLRMFTLINRLYFSTYLITGKEKHTQAKMRILYCNHKKLNPYIRNILFYEEPNYEKKGKMFIWKIRKTCDKTNVDAIIIKSDMFYSGYFEKQDYMIMPEWVSMSLNLNRSLEDLKNKVFSHNVRREIKKASKNNYSYKIYQDIDKLNEFFYQMYLPYNKKRHGESALISNFQSIRFLFEINYKLMMFKQNNDDVSGWLFLLKNKRFRAKYLGILDDKTYLLKKELGAASFYFSIQWAKKQGANVIDFGATRPFLNDGSFIYKKKWGTTIQRAEKNVFFNIYAIKKFHEGKGINSFFQKNPFIKLEKNRLMIMDKRNES